ncbi:MAG TPA: GH3 auxin-responsive promoter family protein [Candidatus Binatia bacterium]|nr:GH3 auxin-responsive promoter family protein [Candidatus Binatia bacterium]
MMSILSQTLISIAGRAAARRFEAATRDPAGAQLRKLMAIVDRNQNTEYGTEHGFAKVKSLEDWQKAVPVVTYDDISERVGRMTRGEQNVLTAEAPVMFAKTSGTSGQAKYIPVTATCQGRDHADQLRAWLHYAYADHPGLFSGKVISLVSPAVEGHTPCGIPYGSTSGVVYRDMPRAVRSTYAVPYPVFEIEDYQAKYYCLMRIGIANEISCVATANPSSVVKLCEMADTHADALLRDLADGTLRPDLDITRPIRESLSGQFKPIPEKARQLEKARQKRSGKLLPADYWPGLTLIACWKGGTVGHYVERFDQWFDPDGRRPIPVRDWGYLSSEARGSIPVTDEGCGGVLTVASNVYEFVEAEELEQNPESPQAWRMHGVESVEVGKQYYIFITTTGGLYRYDINDVIEVVGFYNRTPIISFCRKGRGMTSITGEKVSVDQIIEAFERSARDAAIELGHFKAEADMETARYVFKMEAATPIPQERLRQMLESLEKHLSSLNIEYAAKRKSLRLNPPILIAMKPGWYDMGKQRLVAEGKRLFQAKTILLSERKEEADGESIASTVTLQDKR